MTNAVAPAKRGLTKQSDLKLRAPLPPGSWNLITATEVQEWFADAATGKQLTAPDLEQCNEVASHLNFIIGRGDIEPIERNKELEETIKYGRLFATKLASQREKFTKMLAEHGVRRLPGPIEELVELMHRTEAGALEIIKIIDWPPPKFSWHGDAENIAELAVGAWRTTGKAPKAIDANQPLCLFVTKSLNEINKRIAAVENSKPTEIHETAIRDALLGRRRGAKTKKRGVLRNDFCH
jgi:hypothetical protein